MIIRTFTSLNRALYQSTYYKLPIYYKFNYRLKNNRLKFVLCDNYEQAINKCSELENKGFKVLNISDERNNVIL